MCKIANIKCVQKLYLHELEKSIQKELREEYDWLEDIETKDFLFYNNNWYCLSDFIANDPMSPWNTYIKALDNWKGYYGLHYSACIVIDNIENDFVKMGYFTT